MRTPTTPRLEQRTSRCGTESVSKTVVDPANYEAAATIFGADIAGTLLSIYQSLRDKLAGIGSMAGSDPAGTDFGAAYDLQASAITRVTQDVVNGCYKLAGLLSATGFNHGQANEASVLGGPPNPRWTTDPHDYANSSASLAELHAGSGSGGIGSPFWWYMVVENIDYPWPDGNPGKVHSAAAAWSVAAQAITTLTNVVPLATGAIAQVQSIEVEPATTVCNAMGARLHDLSAAYNAMFDGLYCVRQRPRPVPDRDRRRGHKSCRVNSYRRSRRMARSPRNVGNRRGCCGSGQRSPSDVGG